MATSTATFEGSARLFSQAERERIIKRAEDPTGSPTPTKDAEHEVSTILENTRAAASGQAQRETKATLESAHNAVEEKKTCINELAALKRQLREKETEANGYKKAYNNLLDQVIQRELPLMWSAGQPANFVRDVLVRYPPPPPVDVSNTDYPPAIAQRIRHLAQLGLKPRGTANFE
jgi:hypothetical protein